MRGGNSCVLYLNQRELLPRTQAGKDVEVMKKDILAYKVLCSVLAIGLGGLALPLTAQANSGLSDEPKYMTGYGEYCYIGSNGANDNVVIIDVW